MQLFLEGYLGKDSTYEGMEITQHSFSFGSGSTVVGYGEHASTLVMLEIRNGLQGTDCNDKGASRLAKLCNRIGAIKMLMICFPDFKISHIPRAQNGISDF